jgi:preprotein translocase subunit SecA
MWLLIWKTYETEGAQLVADFEKNITCHCRWSLEETLAQNGWVETIRSTCGSRTKDPLLIYKLEAFNLFRAMIDNVNKVISFLFKGDLAQENQHSRKKKCVNKTIINWAKTNCE